MRSLPLLLFVGLGRLRPPPTPQPRALTVNGVHAPLYERICGALTPRRIGDSPPPLGLCYVTAAPVIFSGPGIVVVELLAVGSGALVSLTDNPCTRFTSSDEDLVAVVSRPTTPLLASCERTLARRR